MTTIFHLFEQYLYLLDVSVTYTNHIKFSRLSALGFVCLFLVFLFMATQYKIAWHFKILPLYLDFGLLQKLNKKSFQGCLHEPINTRALELGY